MNRFKKLGLVAALGALAFAQTANAQFGFDAYGGLRTLVVDAPRLISGVSANSVTSTVPVDIHMFSGKVKVDIFSKTNTGNSATMTANFQTSPDLATWTALANYSLARSTTVIYTNLYYGTNGLTATNTYLLPGTVVTPTASTAGFATMYLDTTASPYTNSGAVSISSDGIYTIGFQADDQQRFLRVYWTPGGNATNSNLGAILTGRLLGGPGAP